MTFPGNKRFRKRDADFKPPLPRCVNGKASYKTKHEAERIRLTQVTYRDVGYLRVYKCPIKGCKLFHLTSSHQKYGKNNLKDIKHSGSKRV